MRYFVYIVSHTPNGRPVDIGVIAARTDAEAVTVLPQAFKNAGEAHRHREQLETFFGLPKLEPQSSGMRRQVIRNDTQIIYASASEAARAHNVSRSAMTQHLRNPHRNRTVAGAMFSYLDDEGVQEMLRMTSQAHNRSA